MDREFRILVLEDSQQDFDLLQRELRKGEVSFLARRVQTRPAFVSELEDFQPDLILSDYSMPAFDGLTALGIVRARSAEVPFIFVSATIGEERAIQAFEVGATDYVLKDRLARLVPAVRRAMREVEDRANRRGLEEQYRGIFENALVGIYQTTLDGCYTMANPTLAWMYGYDSPEKLMASVTNLNRQFYVDPRRRDEFVRLVEEHGRVSGFESQVYRKDGGVIWVSEEARALRDTQGRLVGFEGTTIDVTARKHAEEALREREQQLSSIYDTAADVLFQLAVEPDATYRFTSVNRAFLSVTGLARDQIVGKRVDEVIPEPSRSYVLARYAEAVRERRIVRWEETTEYPTGRLTGEVGIAPVFDAAGTCTHLVGAVHDVTERKSLEQQLIQAQKIEAVGRLAGGVAHDFNNVLTVIMSYSQMLQQDFPPGDPRAADTGQIVEAVRRAQGLTRQLLAFSRQQVVQPVVLDPNAAIRSVEKMLRRLIGEDIEFVFQLSEVAGSLRADAGQFEQVLMNLAVNARDAMPHGGRLTIATAAKTVDAEDAQTLGLAAAGPWVVISIADTGMGMTPEVRSRIFEPFFTTKEPGRGTGLGLATVYGIVRLSGGHVTVDSTPGAGTVFRIYFPCLAAEAPVAVLQAEGDVAGGTETIVIAEDDPAVRGVAADILVRRGYTVIVARHGEEALARVAAHRGSVQLVVTDVAMPGMDGVALVERLRTLHPGVRALFTSGYAGEEIVRRGVLSSGVPFLEKPFTPAGLARKVREVLDSKR